MIAPQTEIRLLHVPFSLDNKNQLTFNSKDEQFEFFNSLDSIQEDNCTYQRKDNVIRFPSHIDNIITNNYVMYQNESYTDKWFYGFITNMQYMNDNMTEITIETDVFQTWQFDIIYKKMFVEREHVTNDTIGLHTLEENLNIGEVVEENETRDINLSDYLYIILECDYDPKTGKEFEYVNLQNGQLFPHGLYAFPYNLSPLGTNVVPNIVNFIRDVKKNKSIEFINNMYVVPSKLFDTEQLELVEMEDYEYYRINLSLVANDYNIEIDKQYSFNDFIPKNNKCFCYPYNYLFVTNNNGNNNIYKYEDFYNEKAIFNVRLSLQIGGSGRLFPTNYKKANINVDESIALGKYPTFSWSSDAFTNWLTQNAVNMATNLAMSTVNTSSQITSGNIVAGATNFAETIANQIGGFYSASLLPNMEGGQNTGDVIFSSNLNTFIFRNMRVKTEYLKIIDDYFTMFGYKVNSLKIPNITGRPNWNYVKTTDANIIGNIPQEDLQTIKNILNSGVTFWHNANTFLDYSQNNK